MTIDLLNNWSDHAGHLRMTYIGKWIQSRFRIPNAEYHALAQAFNPILFNADEWVQLAQDAGMKYIVVTAKHHEDFALFRSKVSRFNLVDTTSFGRDAIEELANACARRGMKLRRYLFSGSGLERPQRRRLPHAGQQPRPPRPGGDEPDERLGLP